MIILVALSLTLGMTACYWPGLPNASILKTEYPVVRMEWRDGRHLGVVHLQKSRPASWVNLAGVNKLAVNAIMVSEDWAFFQHKGYDPKQIREALNRDLNDRKFTRGASTITQQVARNVFLDQDKTVLRKLKELALAVQMERKLNKQKILEVYLNIAEFGDSLYGIGPAAHYYFDKSPSELNAKEGAFLAMLLPSPKRYSVSFRAHRLTEYARDTIETILDKMQQAHFITVDQKMAEVERPLSWEKVPGAGEAPTPLPTEDPEGPSGDEDEAAGTALPPPPGRPANNSTDSI